MFITQKKVVLLQLFGLATASLLGSAYSDQFSLEGGGDGDEDADEPDTLDMAAAQSNGDVSTLTLQAIGLNNDEFDGATSLALSLQQGQSSLVAAQGVDSSGFDYDSFEDMEYDELDLELGDDAVTTLVQAQANLVEANAKGDTRKHEKRVKKAHRFGNKGDRIKGFPIPDCPKAPALAIDMFYIDEENFCVKDVVLRLHMYHEKASDLEITLVGPSEFKDNPNIHAVVIDDNFGKYTLHPKEPLTFSDYAAVPARYVRKILKMFGWQHDHVPGVIVKPRDSFSEAFEGINAHGVWRLIINDDSCDNRGLYFGAAIQIVGFKC